MTALPQGLPRSPWQRLYASAHRRRQRYWDVHAERLPLPVWSVGNLHWGGTGKTPLVLALAGWLRERGVRAAVLSRGYGRRSKAPLLVSRGEEPLAPPALAGDEPWLLAEGLPGVAVAVAARRAEAGRLVLSTMDPPPHLFILDDGFSHLRLHRDLDLLVLPAADPFGGGRLLPGGRLREPLAAVARAAAVLLAGAGATAEAARNVSTSLASFGFRGAAFACPTVAGAPRPIGGAPPGDEGRMLLVTGVARPERVRRTAAGQGLEIAGHLAFRDHCRYGPRALRRIVTTAARLGADAVLTTAKDRVKLAGRLPLPLFELPVEARPEGAFWEWCAAELARAGLGDA